MKICTKCKKSLLFTEFGKRSRSRDGLAYACKMCHKHSCRKWKDKNTKKAYETMRRWRKKNPEKVRAWYLKARYKISYEQFQATLDSQDRRCAICTTNEPGSQYWHVDHDHQTGQIRGVLCRSCNQALGLFSDDENTLRRAGNYLKYWRGRWELKEGQDE